MMLNASARSTVAQDTLIRVLETMSGRHVESASTTIPLLGTKLTTEQILENPEFAARIRTSISAFVVELQKHALDTA
jgi:chromate reductase, NAD(P)H dehydrogenase (quinone)